MPTAPSAKKELRKKRKLTRHNIRLKKVIKEEIKKVELLLKAKKQDAAKKEFVTLQKKVDKAVKVNTIKKNRGDRIKSRISKKINNASNTAPKKKETKKK